MACGESRLRAWDWASIVATGDSPASVFPVLSVVDSWFFEVRKPPPGCTTRRTAGAPPGWGHRVRNPVLGWKGGERVTPRRMSQTGVSSPFLRRSVPILFRPHGGGLGVCTYPFDSLRAFGAWGRSAPPWPTAKMTRRPSPEGGGVSCLWLGSPARRAKPYSTGASLRAFSANMPAL